MTEGAVLGASAFWEPQGAVRRLSVVYNGMTYPGDVLVLQRWDSRWGRPLEGDTYFRVVFLQEVHDARQVKVEDARIAVCVPSSRPSVEKQLLQQELLSIREARQRYVTRADRGQEGLRRALESQEQGLESRLMEAQAGLYREGEVVTAASIAVGKEAHAGRRIEEWSETIALHLLGFCYPRPWLDLFRLPRPLVAQDAAGMFDALSAGPDDPCLGLLEEIGPALGLSKPGDPRRFDPEGCPVFEMIRQKLADRAEAPWEELHHYLAHQVGLTGAFATLFLLTFVHSHPGTELRLRPGYVLTLRDGQAMPGDRLIPELVPMLLWKERLEAEVAAMCLPREVSWNSALHYARLVCDRLAEAEDEVEVQAQEQKLLDSLRELAGDVRRAREVLEAIVGSGLALSTKEIEERLARLDSVARCRDFRELFGQARSLYVAPVRLRQELEQLRRLLRLHPLLREILDARSYLEGAQIGPGYGELSLDRAALLERMVMSVVLEDPNAWQAIRASFEQFKKRYSHAYLAFHAAYHADAAALRARLEEARRQVEALGFLNSLSELGRPVGTELASGTERLAAGLRLCSDPTSGLQLEHAPRCLSCDLPLGERPPAGEATSLVAEVGGALREQNQRLSRLLVRDIMQGRAEQRLDDLLKVVQASDLSALVNTLDEEMVEFIRGLLAP